MLFRKILSYVALLVIIVVSVWSLFPAHGIASETPLQPVILKPTAGERLEDTTDRALVGPPPMVSAMAVTTTPLPIPSLLSGTLVGGKRVYNLTMMNGTTQLTGTQQTPTSGYNGTYLGPTLVMTRGEELVINVTNNLGQETTTHWHGFHLPAEMDGGPHQIIANGITWSPTFTMLNRAATYWYHPHLEGRTGAQVYSGLAGMIMVEDSESQALALPTTYGVDEIPLIIQDRLFNADGSFLDPTPPGFRKGDTFLVNGAIAPTLTTYAQMIRFRILNASNARLYNFGFSDNRTFYQIASDSGFLQAPVALTRLLLAPGERAEIVVDFSGQDGQSFTWMAYNTGLGNDYIPPPAEDMYDTTDFDIFGITISGTTAISVTTLPVTLTTISRISASEAANESSPRPFVLGGGPGGPTINGLQMDINRIDQIIKLGDIEIWEITNTSGFAHPFHVHDNAFQILSRNGVDPPDNELGWKDTVLVKRNEVVRIIRPFEDFADPNGEYMFHCHLLEHEDAGMMGQFVVIDTVDTYLPIIVKG